MYFLFWDFYFSFLFLLLKAKWTNRFACVWPIYSALLKVAVKFVFFGVKTTIDVYKGVNSVTKKEKNIYCLALTASLQL